MYERFFGLRERPFELTPNPRYLLLTPGHREALSNIEYGISARKGITVLTGDAGTGKTTLVRCVLGRALASGPQGISRAVVLSNPALGRRDFLELLADGLQLSPRAARSKARFLIELERTLLERRADGPAVLVVDEAQSMPHALLEEIRLLANLESDTEKLLPVVLVGQPELGDRLNEQRLRQLKQRVALRCHLDPLTLGQTGAYVASRISRAGGEPARLFTREAVLEIHERARGIPRTVNVICDNALLTAFAMSRAPVDAAVVSDVCGDFDLQGGLRPVREPSHDEAEQEPATVEQERPGAGRPVLSFGSPLGRLRPLHWSSRA